MTALPALSEAQLQRLVERVAREAGWLVHHHYLAIRSAAGLPDIIAVKAGHLLFAELKGPRGKLTEMQRAWLDALSALGPSVEVYLWTEWDIEEAGRILYRQPVPRGGWVSDWKVLKEGL